MSTKVTKRSSDTNHLQSKVVRALFEYLLKIGMTKKELQVLTARILAKLEASSYPAKKLLREDSTYAAKVSTALQRWYMDRNFVDPNGEPKPLSLHGASPSVEQLMRRANLGKPIDTIAKELVKLKVLRRCQSGKYLPTGRHVIIRSQHPILTEHHARTVARFLNTAMGNMSAKDPANSLIERCSHVPRLPRSKLREFRDFANQQGESLLDNVNYWLESHNVASKTGRASQTTEAGVHVFAFTGTKR
jgi:Family of unknown function (DUF6502)